MCGVCRGREGGVHTSHSSYTLHARAAHMHAFDSCRTDDLKASVRVDLPDVPGAEPSLAVLVHVKVLAVPGLLLVVTHRYIRAADHNFPPWVGLVRAVVSTWGGAQTSIITTSTHHLSPSLLGCCRPSTHPPPSPSA